MNDRASNERLREERTPARPARPDAPAPGGGGPVLPLGRAIRERREELGLLQADLAELAGCSTRFVHTLEHGKPSVRLDKVLDVLHVLGLDLVVAPGRGRVRVGEGSEANR